jgi:hypothetical protein
MKRIQCAGVALICALLGASAWAVEGASGAPTPDSQNLLSRDNLIAWEVHLGGNISGPEERARMLKRLGLRRYAHIQHEAVSASDVDREIEALKKNGIELFAWMFLIDDPSKDSQIRMTLETFKRHGAHPQIWVTQPFPPSPRIQKDFQRAGIVFPKYREDIAKLPEAEQERLFEALHRAWSWSDLENFPESAPEQEERLRKEIARLYSYAKLAEPYGLSVKIYNHDGWYAIPENQLAMIDGLKRKNVTNVGLVYNFYHARDWAHDDTKEFPRLWERIQAHVSVVGIAGVRGELENLYPSQGDYELEMMRTIERSGWRGPIQILAAYHDKDPEGGLRNILKGTEWLAAELRRPGSGGARPFPACSAQAVQ